MIRAPVAVAVAASADRTSELVWPALVALASLAAVVPLWSSELLPLQDAPQHLAAIRVLADYHDPRFAFDKWFEIDLARSQYLGFYLPAALLARFVGPEAACRLVLSGIALALPAVFWMFLRSFDRDVRLAVFAPALFHTAPLYLGFFNFVASIPATIFVVALAEREIRAPRTARAIVLAVSAAALLYLHPSALALALGAVGPGEVACSPELGAAPELVRDRLELGQQLAERVRAEQLVHEPADRPERIGARGGAGMRHADVLVPVEQLLDVPEIRDLAEHDLQPVERARGGLDGQAGCGASFSRR
jgi:hypothetical protein